jgi:hypothetical protein
VAHKAEETDKYCKLDASELSQKNWKEQSKPENLVTGARRKK